MKRIIIIGSGMGGLATGIYAQLNGFQTTIFEAHSIAGGQCTSWQRKGYVFDPTMHNFNGFKPQTKINNFWAKLGALPCEMVTKNEFVSAVYPNGTYVHSYFDLEKLQSHLNELSPEDNAVIEEFINGLKSFVTNIDWFGINYFGSLGERLSILPFFIRRMKYFRETLGSYSNRFKNPELKKVFPLIRHSVPEVPLFAYLVEHANYIIGDSGWPKGGCATLVQNMVANYLNIGGIIHYKKEVVKILIENHNACGIELRDGTQHRADFIISNADGRKTILDMLNGQYMSKKVIKYCEPNSPDKELPMATHIFLGVNRDLSSYPSSLIVFFDKTEIIGDHECDHLDLQIYGFDTSMAPNGKCVIKIELTMKPSYFTEFYDDKAKYNLEKNKIADQVITLLEKQFPNLRTDIEETDVSTVNTWERYMGGSHGFNNFPNKHRELTDIRNVIDMMFGLDRMFTLPGLKNFFLTGQWVTSMGSLFTNAVTGREVAKKICRQCGMSFKA